MIVHTSIVNISVMFSDDWHQRHKKGKVRTSTSYETERFISLVLNISHALKGLTEPHEATPPLTPRAKAGQRGELTRPRPQIPARKGKPLEKET